MNEFETKLVNALRNIGDGLHAVSRSIDANTVDHRDLNDHGTAIERGLSEVAEAINALEINR